MDEVRHAFEVAIPHTTRLGPTGPCSAVVSLAVLGVLLALGPGCMVGPDYRRPDAPLASTWLASDTRLAAPAEVAGSPPIG